MMRYSSSDEQALMTELWSPEVADDPEKFVLFAYPWGMVNTPLAHNDGPRKWQTDALSSVHEFILKNKNADVMDAMRAAFSSGRGIGKSALVSWIIHWFLSTRIGSTAIVTANTEAQLRSVTWSELIKWHTMAINSHWFVPSATRLKPAQWLIDLVERDLKIGTRYWGAEGKTWSKDNPSAFAGVHNPLGVAVIMDEASGIPDAVWDVAAGFFTEDVPDRYWFAFSNPRKNSGYFFECFNGKRDFWKVKQIDAREVEGTDKSIYDQIIAEYGEHSMQAKVEVYGQFPDDDDETFISPSLVDGAFSREMYNDKSAPIVIGVDPARSGSDSTVIAVRKGRDIVKIIRNHGSDTMETVGNVILAIEEYKPTLVVVDEGGLGAGVLDRLKEQKYKQVRGVNFGWKSSKPAAYVNKRAEMWGLMREWLASASISKDPALKADLCGARQKPTSTGSIQLESKADMRSRGLASPDSADAICVTFAYSISSPEVTEMKRNARVNKQNYSYGNGGWLGG
jgi:hypothetical protein